VQYLKFRLDGRAPVAIGCDLDDGEVRAEKTLTVAQHRALASDLA
jgi:hypothetical protein